MHALATSIIFGISYLLIATERVDKTIAAILGASLIVALHLAPYEELLHHVDLNVIFLLAGMMIIVNILATTGVFEWMAVMIAKKAGGNGAKIILLLLVATAVMSAFLDNVTTIILVAPVTILIAQILEISALPILILEAIFSNIGGTATLVGDPPNILIGSKAQLSFNQFILNLGPVVVIILVLLLFIIAYILRKRVEVSKAAMQRIMKARPAGAIVKPLVLKKALPVLALVMLGFFLGRTLNIEPGIVALAGAALMALICKADMHSVMQKVEWTTMFFFIGLFIMVGALELNGVFDILGTYVLALTKGNLFLTVVAVLWTSAILSAIVDNIPLVIGMIPLIKSIIPGFIAGTVGGETIAPAAYSAVAEPLFWALALGACLGGNGSLVGASANVVISQIALRNKYNMSFWEFTKYGFPIMLVTLVICTIYLYLRYFT